MGITDRTKDVKQAGERARGRIAGQRRGPGWLGALVIGAIGSIAGALVAFLTDPQRGRARRAQLLDQGAATVRNAGREAERVVRAATSLAEGKLEALTEGGSRVPPVDDVTIRDRAETELFRDASVPKGTINLSVERGILVLRGEVPDEEMRDRLVRQAEGIEGVWSVRNMLHLPGEPAGEEKLAETRSG
jgi:hyperosmotically inducible periplasmic protein